MLAQVSEGHNGRQKNGQRKGQRHKSGTGVEQQLPDDIPFQALSYQVIHILPEELHQEDKNGNEESQYQGADIGLNYQKMDLLQLQFANIALRCKDRDSQLAAGAFGKVQNAGVSLQATK